MPRFRKKPVVIEAEQYDASGIPGICDERCREVDNFSDGYRLVIQTLEGDMEARPGDYIIKGVKGELYPCKLDIFRMTYDPLDETVSVSGQAKAGPYGVRAAQDVTKVL